MSHSKTPNAPERSPAEWEKILRSSLAQSSEQLPRPLTPLELPFKMDVLLKPLLARRLKPAAVLVPVVRRRDGWRVLLTRRSAALRAHGGQISFPGGRRDPGDRSAADNALREAQEEIGLPPQRVEVIGFLDDYPTVTGYRVTPVVGLVSPPRRYQPDAREVAEIFEVPLEFALKPAHYRRRIFTRGALRIPYYELQYEDYRIWGATAGMLWNLTRTLKP